MIPIIFASPSYLWLVCPLEEKFKCLSPTYEIQTPGKRQSNSANAREKKVSLSKAEEPCTLLFSKHQRGKQVPTIHPLYS